MPQVRFLSSRPQTDRQKTVFLFAKKTALRYRKPCRHKIKIVFVDISPVAVLSVLSCPVAAMAKKPFVAVFRYRTHILKYDNPNGLPTLRKATVDISTNVVYDGDRRIFLRLAAFCRLRHFKTFTGLYPTEYIFVPDCARFVPFTFILKFLLCLLFLLYLCFNYYYNLYLYWLFWVFLGF